MTDWPVDSNGSLNEADSTESEFELVFQLLRDRNYVEAHRVCDALLERDPHNPEVHHTKGVVAADSGEWHQACVEFERAALDVRRDHRYFISLAIALWSTGRADAAIDALDSGLQGFPDNPELLLQRAKLLVDGNDLRALSAVPTVLGSAAVMASPEMASDANDLLARAARMAEESGDFVHSGHFWEALTELNPRDYAALNNLARVRSSQGRIQESLELYRRASKIKGAPDVVGSNLLLTMLYDLDARPGQIYGAHRAWAKRVGDTGRRESTGGLAKRKKLRVGYVSADFRLHAVAYFAEPLFQAHNAERVEVHCFSNGTEQDRVTARFQRYAAAWHQIDLMDDDEAAECIRRARIDVLVDMSGHSSNNRLPLFARRAAPIQANYLGYQATSGLQAIDYRFTDSIADPPGQSERFHSETLVRLDPCFQCYRPLLAGMPVAPPPFEDRGFVTLGCFATRPKLNLTVLETWAEILRQSKKTRLKIKCYSLSDAEVRKELVAFFTDRGIAGNRIELMDWTPTPREHLRSYSEVDVMLDTFPYNSVTMTCEALWRGVSTVTWAGDTFVSRMGASILSQLGVDGLIATTATDYVQKAVDLIADRPRLSLLRRSLRGLMRRSPLMDSNRLARQMEDAYFRMWRD